MNREFEFRIYDKLEKVMLTYDNWGGIVDENYEKYYSDEWYPCYDLLTNLFCLDVHIGKDRYIVMQYTGLKDKNGVKIFEGDIVMFDYEWTKPNETGVITWNKNTASFQIKGHIPSSSMKHLSNMKVIGNIYENNLESEENNV